MFEPLDEPAAAPPSPDVKFAVGDIVHIHKLGWCGSIKIAEIRGEHVRAEGKISAGVVWFHHTEVRPGASCTCAIQSLAGKH